MEAAARRGRRGRGLRAARRGGALPAQGPSPHPHTHPAPSPLPHHSAIFAPSLTWSLRLASAPASSSDSKQGAWLRAAAMCSAVLLVCRDAAHTHAGEQPAGGWRVPVEADATPQPTPRPPPPQPRSPPCRRACEPRGRPRAGSRQQGRQRGAAVEGRNGASGASPARGQWGSGAQPPPAHSLTPHPWPPRRSRAAAHMGALGIQADALGDEAVDAAEVAVGSRPYEGRPAVLRRRQRAVSGGGEGRAQQGGGRGDSGGRGADGGWERAGGAALTLSLASRLTPLSMSCSRLLSLPSLAAFSRAVMPWTCRGAEAAPHAVSGSGKGGAAGINSSSVFIGGP